MKLKQQITLLISLALIVPAIAISSVAIYKIKSKATTDIEEYRQEEFAKLKLYLKHITDIAYGVIENAHKQSLDSTSADSTLSQEVLLEKGLAELSSIRFDKGQGYFWVTDNKLPFPTMLMHAEKKNLKGQILDDPKHNVEKEKGRNIYQVRAELANANGDAFVEYIMKKPGSDAVENKISYSRLYKPLGWIVSTGFYTDQIEAAVAEKKAALTKQISDVVIFIVTIGVVILALGLFVSFYFSKELTNAIIVIKEKLKQLAQGEQIDHAESKRKDEVGDMTDSLNSLVDGLKTYTSFAKEIGQGNLNQDFAPLSNEDILGTELLMMRNNLKTAEDEKNIRDWANEGLARLGDVLRRNNTNTKNLADEILKELVKYLKINQGALFIVDEEQANTLELAAAYAYDKKKYVNKKIGFGEGLAGQCVLERHTIHLREIPKDYIQITSGLGQALPRTLILVPLIHNENVYGVLEMASFKELEKHEISFVEKIAESIASTVSTVRGNENTKRLLEQSQQMSEELKAQEEEVRQNMEELSATQEQMGRQVEENKIITDDLK
ncbi:MAG TPA: cache domain-containing protein, partial [Cyclobacteriaceae bacterium]